MKSGSRNKMKRKCKNVNLRDYKNLIPAIRDVVFRHVKRYDFKSLLVHFGTPLDEYHGYFLTRDKTTFDVAIENIAKECVRRISERDLQLRPVVIRIKMDKSTGKVRQIGKESAMQQVFDYIAFYSAKEIFDKRIIPEQASSIPGRGQIYGMQMIKGWIDKDNDALRYAQRHKVRYTRKCKYHEKNDVTKCYPSAKIDCFLKLFRKDCGNEDIIWLWETILRSHQVQGYTGFMIGSLVSQWAVQYMMSFAYRHIKDLHYERRSKKYKCVEHMLIFMDDILLIGSNRKQLKYAVKELIRYMSEELCFTIKSNWQIHDIDEDPIDMMGFIIYADGHVEIRGRDYIRARRMALRYFKQDRFLTLRQCKRITSYKGYFKYSDTLKAVRMYDLKTIFRYASSKIGYEERKKNGKEGCEKLPGTGSG